MSETGRPPAIPEGPKRGGKEKKKKRQSIFLGEGRKRTSAVFQPGKSRKVRAGDLQGKRLKYSAAIFWGEKKEKEERKRVFGIAPSKEEGVRYVPSFSISSAQKSTFCRRKKGNRAIVFINTIRLGERG